MSPTLNVSSVIGHFKHSHHVIEAHNRMLFDSTWAYHICMYKYGSYSHNDLSLSSGGPPPPPPPSLPSTSTNSSQSDISQQPPPWQGEEDLHCLLVALNVSGLSM